MKVYVGNLDWHASEEELQQHFETCGTVVSVNIIKDRDTGRSRGFGFVEFETRDAGTAAVEKLNGQDFRGRGLRVNEAQAKPQGSRGNF